MHVLSIRYIALIIVLLFVCMPAKASESPYQLSLMKETTLLGAGIMLTVGNYYIHDYHPVLTQNDLSSMSRNDVIWFDRSATYNWSGTYDVMSDRTRDAAFIMPAALLLSPHIRNDFLTIAVLYVQTALISEGVTDLLKAMVARPRPYVYNENINDEFKMKRQAIRSFPSGHTSTAFYSAVFFATVFSDYYPDSRWRLPLWIAAVSTASATGYFRYKAGRHYYSDVIVGAIIGALAGFGVPYVHKRKKNDTAIIPSMRDGLGMSVAFSF